MISLQHNKLTFIVKIYFDKVVFDISVIPRNLCPSVLV